MSSAPAATDPSERPVPLTTSMRLRRWAVRRGRQLLWVSAIVVLGLALLLAGVLIWRSASLIGLPDVGDPFDVAAAARATIPDDQNAFAFLKRATARLGPRPNLPESGIRAGMNDGWTKADPVLRAWLADNHAALDLFRAGANQADGFAHPVGDESAFVFDRVNLWPFLLLVRLEASKLEAQGDMAGAWALYQTVLRMRAHVMRRQTVWERFQAERLGGPLRGYITAWAADPRTEVSHLRHALDDAIATAPRPEWDASSLRVDYALALREFDRPDSVLLTPFVTNDPPHTIAGEPLPPALERTLFSAYRFVLHEPERSRRVIRLVFANWLMHSDNPAAWRRGGTFRTSFTSDFDPERATWLPLDPSVSDTGGRHTLPPAELARWLTRAQDAKRLLSQWPWPSISLQERRGHRALMNVLAAELYRREHGASALSEDDVARLYLKGLPDDDDGANP